MQSRLLRSHQVLKVNVAGICSNRGQRAGNVSFSLGKGECDFSTLACRSGILENQLEGSLYLSVLGSSELHPGSSDEFGSSGLGVVGLLIGEGKSGQQSTDSLVSRSGF